MTLITEYIGDVDYIKNRKHDDCDSMMTLLLASNPSRSLVVCPDKCGNIARFINGINNFTPYAFQKFYHIHMLNFIIIILLTVMVYGILQGSKEEAKFEMCEIQCKW